MSVGRQDGERGPKNALVQHNDEPTLNDELGRTALVQQVAEAIVKSQPPQVFGIHGDWGLGKTSFLQMLQFHLSGDCPARTARENEDAKARTELRAAQYEQDVSVVWFEAWRYEGEAMPVVALLHEIRSQLDWMIKVRAGTGKLLEVAVRGALLSLEDLTKKIGFQVSKIEAAADKWEREHFAYTLPAQAVREQLSKAIGDLISPPMAEGATTPHRRLVVLIDDLDRCSGETAFRLMEGLKIYLTLPNCVFVLGMNQRVVEDGVARAMKELKIEEQKARAAAYLEKLCQNVWRLPSVADPKGLLCRWINDEALRNRVNEAIGNYRCLPPNPRRLKGLANLIVRLARYTPNRDGLDIIRETRLLLIVASIYQFHPDLYIRWEYSPALYRRLVQWIHHQEGSDAEFLKALKMPTSYLLSSETAPTRSFTEQEAFPDPTEPNVLWVQPLLHELDDVAPEAFLPYLRSLQA